ETLLLRVGPEVAVVDVEHDIEPGLPGTAGKPDGPLEIVRAAEIRGTVLVVGVDPQAKARECRSFGCHDREWIVGSPVSVGEHGAELLELFGHRRVRAA